MEWKKELLTLLSLITFSSCNIIDSFKGAQAPGPIVINENFMEQKTCIIGDTGTGSSDQLLVANAMAGENCQNVIHTGDIIYPSGIKNISSPLLESNFLKPFEKSLNLSRLFLSLGNHDYRGKPELWFDIARTKSNLYIPHYFYSVVFNDVCLVFIDTNLNYRKSQESWIKSQLNGLNGNCKQKIAIGHHPYISSGHHGKAPGMIHKFLKNHIVGNFDFYLAGHDHQLSVEKPIAGTEFIISGAGAKVRPVKKQKATYSLSDLGFITLTYKDNSTIFEIKRVDQSGIGHTAFTYPLKMD